MILGMLDEETAYLSHLLFHVDARIDWVNLISRLLNNSFSFNWLLGMTCVQSYGSRSTLQALKILFKVYHTFCNVLSLSNNLSHIFLKLNNKNYNHKL